MSGDGNGQPAAPPAGWTELSDGRVVPAGDWTTGSQGGSQSPSVQIVCVRQPGQAPVFQGILNPDGTLALLDSGGQQLGVGAFGADGQQLRVTMKDGSAQTIDLKGTTLQVLAGNRTTDLAVMPDGHLQPVPQPAGGATPPGDASGTVPMVTLPNGQTEPLSEWLQQGPMVIEPDGRRVTENAFVYQYGEGWVAVKDAGGNLHMERLSDYLAEGPNNPLVITPDGQTMTEAAFFYYNGGNPADWVTYQDDKGTHLVLRSDFEHMGPAVVLLDGQEMPQGEFLLTHPNDPKNPWIFVPYQGDVLAIQATDFETSIEDMVALSNGMYTHTDEVNRVLSQLYADMGGFEACFGSDDIGRQLKAVWPDAWKQLTTNVSLLAANLSIVGDNLSISATDVWAAEEANLKGLSFPDPIPPAPAPRPLRGPF